MPRSRADATRTEAEELHERLGELWKAGRYAEALPVAERLVSLARAEAGAAGEDEAAALNDLALIHKQLGNLVQAENAFQQALAAGEAGDHAHCVAATLNNLGMLYLERNEPGRAGDLLGRALALRERVFGPDHPETANSLNNLGLACREAGELEQALAIRGRVLGPEHPDVAAALNTLAGAYAALGRRDRATPLLRRALEIWRTSLGEAHPRVVDAMVNLAASYRSAGDTSAARALYAECLAALRATVGGAHAAYAMVLNNLGGTLYEAGDFAGAGERAARRPGALPRSARLGRVHPARRPVPAGPGGGAAVHLRSRRSVVSGETGPRGASRILGRSAARTGAPAVGRLLAHTPPLPVPGAGAQRAGRSPRSR
jgi:tetratricopeptide (TPR) repeat protein